jgi:hypothetical protein
MAALSASRLAYRAIASIDLGTLTTVPDRLSRRDWRGVRDLRRISLSFIAAVDLISYHACRLVPQIDGNARTSLVVCPPSF